MSDPARLVAALTKYGETCEYLQKLLVEHEVIDADDSLAELTPLFMTMYLFCRSEGLTEDEAKETAAGNVLGTLLRLEAKHGHEEIEKMERLIESSKVLDPDRARRLAPGLVSAKERHERLLARAAVLGLAL